MTDRPDSDHAGRRQHSGHHDRRQGDFGLFIVGFLVIALFQTFTIYMMMLDTKTAVLDVKSGTVQTRALILDEEQRDKRLTNEIVDSIIAMDTAGKERELHLVAVLQETIRQLHEQNGEAEREDEADASDTRGGSAAADSRVVLWRVR